MVLDSIVVSESLQKMLRHAKSALEGCMDASPAERTRKFQEFLKIENRRLLLLHRSGGGGVEVARRRSAMMDTLLDYLFQIANRVVDSEGQPKGKKSNLPEIALVATGGYGRGELNPYSDVDILFLIQSARGPHLAQINAVVEQVLYMLWDLGLKVGHATRTIRECVEQGRKDMHSRTALLEARFLDGSEKVFKELQKALHDDLRGNVEQYVKDRLKDQIDRHKKYDNTVFVQEPNVKNGCGGLRDFQSFLWIARFKYDIAGIADLHNKGLLPQIEAGRLKRAYDFLMRVRNELHYIHGHPTDEIALSFQPKIAEALGYKQKDVLVRIETFMRDYYRHARDIFVLTESLTKKLTIEQPQSRSKLRRLFSRSTKVEKIEGGLILHNGLIDIADGSPFPRDAHDLMQVFRTAQIRSADLSGNLQSLIRRHLKLVDRKFLYSKRAKDIFISILHSKGDVARILRRMHECGLLGQYIPEFGRMDCLVQHEFYHRYTADEHTLVAIQKLDDILNAKEGSASRYSRIFQQLENAQLLYLSILLHDTGKAYHVRHHSDASTVCAQQVARRLCLDLESRRTLIWLVDNHTTMSQIAQRRDIEDPATIEDMMELVENRPRLDMLHLLTFVDGQAVGTSNWSDWRQSILWQLYESTARALETSGVEQVNIETQRENLKQVVMEKLGDTISREEIDAHFTHMPNRYWRRVEAAELIWHLEIVHEFFMQLLDEESESTRPMVKWRHFPDRGYSEAVVCTWDRHGLFAKIAGSLASARLNILSADIYTRSDDIVLDIFQVCDLEHKAIKDGQRTAKMLNILSQSLKGDEEMSFGEQIVKEYESMRNMPLQDAERFPTKIVFNNDDSPEYTILEIQTPDRLGLLYHVLDVLEHSGIDIYLAKINTEKGAAMDVFYLTNSDGNKITSAEQLDSLTAKLKGSIDALNQPYRDLFQV